MDNQTTAAAAERLAPGWERYREWLRTTTALLYRHQPQPDVDALAAGVAQRFGAALAAAGDVADPASFVHQTVASATIEALRATRAVAPEVADELGTGRIVELASQVDRAVATLAPELRQVVGLYLQGFTRQEIALLADLADDDARHRVHDALKGLAEALAVLGIDHAGE